MIRKMFSPEEQQIEICLLKSNLEEIENDIILQRSAMPALDAENEQKYRETMAALQVTRTLNAEIERLNLENVRLTAKRNELKRQSGEITKSIKGARESRDELVKLIKQEEQDIELKTRYYEDTLQGIADRFRKTRGYYNENEVNVEIDKVNTTVMELENELGKRQCVVDDLKRQLDGLQPKVPEVLLTIIGKTNLKEEIKNLSDKHEALTKEINIFMDQEKSATQWKILKN